MTNTQFNFSLSVGMAIVALGAMILSEATVGYSLVALGSAIAGLALFSRFRHGGEARVKVKSSSTVTRRLRNPASDY